MAGRKSSRKPVKRIPKVKVNCLFCNEGKEPDYKDYKTLRPYISERSKIISKSYTGICSKHQRRVSVAIKRARHLGLLPFVPSL